MAPYQTKLFLITQESGVTKEYGVRQRALLNEHAFALAKAEITSWPGYAKTPLMQLDGLASALGVGSVVCKHEGFRFGIGSFKPTGPTYAMLAVLKGEIARATGIDTISTKDLVQRKYGQITGELVVAAATSGNHGRALAWGAQTFGCRAVLYMNDGVSAGREEAIVEYGGEVVRVPGAYDQAVQRMQQDAETKGYFVIGEQGTVSYPQIPTHIMQGYALVVDELVEQSVTPLTHLFVPGGGGILAAACCGYLWERFGGDGPRLIVVEPTMSSCLYESARLGRLTRVGEASSVMDGLVVEEPSAPALEMLGAGAFAFLTIPDEAAVDAMRQAVDPKSGDPPAVIGDTGAAGWAGFLAAASDEGRRRQLGLTVDSRVAVVVTEGATDPTVYRRLTGKHPEQVMGAT
jgi:diaminopropionate ammonia-lyase